LGAPRSMPSAIRVLRLRWWSRLCSLCAPRCAVQKNVASLASTEPQHEQWTDHTLQGPEHAGAVQGQCLGSIQEVSNADVNYVRSGNAKADIAVSVSCIAMDALRDGRCPCTSADSNQVPRNLYVPDCRGWSELWLRSTQSLRYIDPRWCRYQHERCWPGVPTSSSQARC
jgi:hypothetical protein